MSEPKGVSLLHEIRHRRLWLVLAIYGLASWVVFEVVDRLTVTLQLPPWFPTIALVLLLVGLPVVLATAVLDREVRPGRERGAGDEASAEAGAAPAAEGSVRLDSRSPGLGALRRFLTWPNAIAGGVFAFAMWGVIAAGWMVFGSLFTPGPGRPGALSDERPVVAVLPFANRSALESDAYFTDGMHDEILTQLTKISSLKVISRTSVMGYRNEEKNVREIGQELGADYLLEGSLLRAGAEVRLNVQLIHAASDEHVWAQSFDHEMTVANLLTIQSEIVRSMVLSLRGVLSPDEEARLSAVPTESIEAYEFYLRGEDWLNRGGRSEEEYRIAAQMYEQAIEVDPDFALSHAKLSSAHIRLHFQGHDRSPERAAMAKAAIDRAVVLSPNRPEVHEALGDHYYYGRREYDQALEEYRAALEQLPGSAELMARIAWVQRRKGQWEESLGGLQRVVEMDPRSGRMFSNLAVSLQNMRRYEEADEAYGRAQSLTPEVALLWWQRSINYLNWRGSADEARAMWSGAPGNVLRNPRSQLARLLLELFDENFAEVLARLENSNAESFDSQWEWYPTTLLRAWALEGLSETERAGAAYDSARVVLERAERIRPDDERVPSALGYALAGLGRNVEAVDAGLRGVALLPISKDSGWGPKRVLDLAAIHARVGEPEDAIRHLDHLLGIHSGLMVSVALLRSDPRFHPLRDDPGFKALLEVHDR